MNIKNKSSVDSVINSFDNWIQDTDKITPHSFLSHDLKGLISNDPCMKNNLSILRFLAKEMNQKPKIIDFGCGNLRFKQCFEELLFDWVGLDYSDSIDPEYHKGKKQTTGKIIYYDGLNVPFEDNEFDMVWSSQALEHIQDIDITFSEISRILKHNGYFAGSVSFLEAYHARSTYSYTPYGFLLLLKKYNLQLEKITPGVDGFTLLLKRLAGILNDDQDWSKIFQQGGLLSSAIKEKMLKSNFTETDVSALLLQLCGHFRFIAKKV